MAYYCATVDDSDGSFFVAFKHQPTARKVVLINALPGTQRRRFVSLTQFLWGRKEKLKYSLHEKSFNKAEQLLLEINIKVIGKKNFVIFWT